MTPNNFTESPLLTKEGNKGRSEPSTKFFKKLKPPTFRPLPPTYEYALRWINLSTTTQGKGLVDKTPNNFNESPLLAKERDGERSESSKNLSKKLKPHTQLNLQLIL
jgi:hypothetical protein